MGGSDVLITGEEGAEEAGDAGKVLPQLTQNLAGRSVGTGFPQNAQNLGIPAQRREDWIRANISDQTTNSL